MKNMNGKDIIIYFVLSYILFTIGFVSFSVDYLKLFVSLPIL